MSQQSQLTLLQFPGERRVSGFEEAARIRQHGADGLSLEELVTFLAGPDVAAVLGSNGRWSDFFNVDYLALQEKGVPDADATAFLACMEFARRIARMRLPHAKLLERPDRTANYLFLRYARCDQEVMGAIFLNVRNRLIADEVFFQGCLSRTSAEPRTILRRALELNAAAFVLFHTHPSGDPAPSAEDLQFTRRLDEAAKTLGVRMHDHLIVGSAGRWVSVRRRGGF